MSDDNKGPEDKSEIRLQEMFQVFGRKQESDKPPLESLSPSRRLVPNSPLTKEESNVVFWGGLPVLWDQARATGRSDLPTGLVDQLRAALQTEIPAVTTGIAARHGTRRSERRDILMNQPGNFDGFITPDGELVSIEDVDQMLSDLSQRTENTDEIVQALWGLAGECAAVGRFAAAYGYYQKILVLVDTTGEKAECLLAMGQAREQSGDHKAALDVYSRAAELPQEPDLVWYFLHNNYAYCLNLESRYQEAEAHCRAAIEIDSERHNAHKNLGIALQGLGRYCDAARSFITAMVACPEDHRALGHLEDLVAAHGEILEQEPGLLDLRRGCHEVAGSTRGKPSLQ
ncbi:MAG: tetratricopeptide repeat protein [Acidobacteriia bacterium]|nr:tetratricopeptide repeat protein [Terriglobia bacterium]